MRYCGASVASTEKRNELEKQLTETEVLKGSTNGCVQELSDVHNEWLSHLLALDSESAEVENECCEDTVSNKALIVTSLEIRTEKLIRGLQTTPEENSAK